MSQLKKQRNLDGINIFDDIKKGKYDKSLANAFVDTVYLFNNDHFNMKQIENSINS